MSNKFPPELGELRVATAAHDVGLEGGYEGNGQSRSQSVDCVRMVHLMRFSLCYVSFKDRKAVAADLKLIYRAASAEEAEQHLAAFAQQWNSRYPSIAKSWQANWARVIPMFGFPEDIRRAVYTTNAIESLNMSLRKVIKTRASFPNDEAAFKLLYLALRNIAKKWTMPIKNWSQAMQAFSIIFEGRVPTLDGNSFTQFI
jgi:putative transposase